MRLPLTVSFGPRSFATDKDEVSLNAFVESGASGQQLIVKRPGTDHLVIYPPGDSYAGYNIVPVDSHPGQGQGVYQNGVDLYFVRGAKLFGCCTSDVGYPADGTAAMVDLGGSEFLPYTFVQMPIDNGDKAFFLKSTEQAYQVIDMVATQVTDTDYPAVTVGGAAFLDGTYYVMTEEGNIFGSELQDPLTWSALNVIRAGSMPDSGVAIRRMVNYVVAFGEYTTEFFYDAGNPTGSPLLPVQNAIALVGCASARSIAETENTLYFMGRSVQRGRSIYRLNGTIPEKISTPFIDRFISESDLVGVWAYFVKINGHPIYVMTLGDLERTVVYDVITNMWHEWTVLFPGAWGPGG
jgi:hypothetical protein